MAELEFFIIFRELHPNRAAPQRGLTTSRLVRFLKSRSVRAGIACKHAALVSYRLFEDFDEVTAAACVSSQHKMGITRPDYLTEVGRGPWISE